VQVGRGAELRTAEETASQTGAPAQQKLLHQSLSRPLQHRYWQTLHLQVLL
jgi:hypothetical protein